MIRMVKSPPIVIYVLQRGNLVYRFLKGYGTQLLYLNLVLSLSLKMGLTNRLHLMMFGTMKMNKTPMMKTYYMAFGNSCHSFLYHDGA